MTGDHQVLTTRGWVPIAEVTIQHKVATLQGDHLKYETPTDVYKYDDIQDELYDLRSEHVEITCTNNHRMYVKKRDRKQYELIEARKIMGKRVSYLKNAKLGIDIPNCREYFLLQAIEKKHCTPHSINLDG